MSEDYVERKEIGDYRITINRDDCAECPTESFDLLGSFIWEFNDMCSMRLSTESDTEDLPNSPHDMEDALKGLVCKHVSQKKIIEYIQKECKDLVFKYNKSDHIWELFSYDWRNDKCSEYSLLDLHPDEFHDFDFRDEICDNLGQEDFVVLLRDYQDEIAFMDFATSGYCQGDYANGFAWCDIESFKDSCCTDTKKWRERAVEVMDDEVKLLGKWMWGDVYSFVLEKRERFTKHYVNDEKSDVDSFEWEAIDSCSGYYEEPDEIIQMVIEENNLHPKNAA